MSKALKSILVLALSAGVGILAQAQVEQPRELTEEELAKVRKAVQNSKARNLGEIRQAELAKQRAQLQREAQARQQEEDEAQEKAEAARQRAAAARNSSGSVDPFMQGLATLGNELKKNQAAQAQQQQFINGLERQRAEAADRQRTEAQSRQRVQAASEQQELVRRANQRQDEEAARLAEQRRQNAQQRADAQARNQELLQNAAVERKRLQDQREAQARAAQATGALTLAPREVAPVADAPKPTAPAIQPAVRDEAVMGFHASTCAQARANAKNWVGGGGTFEVKSEAMVSNGCLVQIHRWKSGPGTASRQ